MSVVLGCKQGKEIREYLTIPRMLEYVYCDFNDGQIDVTLDVLIHDKSSSSIDLLLLHRGIIDFTQREEEGSDWLKDDDYLVKLAIQLHQQENMVTIEREGNRVISGLRSANIEHLLYPDYYRVLTGPIAQQNETPQVSNGIHSPPY